MVINNFFNEKVKPDLSFDLKGSVKKRRVLIDLDWKKKITTEKFEHLKNNTLKEFEFKNIFLTYIVDPNSYGIELEEDKFDQISKILENDLKVN